MKSVAPLRSRRSVLIALAASAMVPGCPRPLSATWLAEPKGPITLGWRWVPGMTLTYQTTTTRLVGEAILPQTQRWLYLVRALDNNNVATLQAVQQPKNSKSSPGVVMQLGMNGELQANSAGTFAEQIPHYLLALPLQTTPIYPQAEWEDPILLRPFRALMPEDAELTLRSSTRLLELNRREDTTMAALESRAVIKTQTGMSLRIHGMTNWDAINGVIASRTLDVRFLPTGRNPDTDPGTLRLELQRV